MAITYGEASADPLLPLVTTSSNFGSREGQTMPTARAPPMTRVSKSAEFHGLYLRQSLTEDTESNIYHLEGSLDVRARSHSFSSHNRDVLRADDSKDG